MVYRYQWLSVCLHYHCGCFLNLFRRLQMNNFVSSIHRNRDKMGDIWKHFKCTFIKKNIYYLRIWNMAEGFAYKMRVDRKNNCKTRYYLPQNTWTWDKIPKNNVFVRSWLLVARRRSGGKPLLAPIIVLFADLYIGQNLVWWTRPF